MNPVANTIRSVPLLNQQSIKEIGRLFLKISSIALIIIGGISLAILIIRKLESSRAVPQANPLINGFEEIKTTALRILENENVYAQSISAKITLQVTDGNNFDSEDSSIIPAGEELSPNSISREMNALFRQCMILPAARELNAHSPSLQCKAVIILKNRDLATFGWTEVSKRVNLLGSPSNQYFNALPITRATQNVVMEAAGIYARFFDDQGNLV